MKYFVIATVSAVALLGNAYANVGTQENTAETKKVAAAHEMAAQPAHHMHHAHKHHAHKHHHHKHHHRFHGHHGHALAVYVNYPLVNVPVFNACQPEFYQGNKEHAYIWHEGYFWYPHAHGEMIPGYRAHFMHGAYWYPSQLHPHKIYIDKETMAPHAVYPVQIGTENMHHRAHKGMHKHRHHHHKAKKHHHAAKKEQMKVEHHAAEAMPKEEGMAPAAPKAAE